MGIVSPGDLPAAVAEVAGRSRTSQLRCFINALVDCISSTGEIGMRQPYADALASLRGFNYEHIYTRPSSVAQGEAVMAVLSSLVEFFSADPARIPPAGPGLGTLRQPEAGAEEPEFRVRRAITYVSGMTDRFAFSTAVELLGWPRRAPTSGHRRLGLATVVDLTGRRAFSNYLGNAHIRPEDPGPTQFHDFGGNRLEGFCSLRRWVGDDDRKAYVAAFAHGRHKRDLAEEGDPQVLGQLEPAAATEDLVTVYRPAR